jgi:hypothetical protein
LLAAYYVLSFEETRHRRGQAAGGSGGIGGGYTHEGWEELLADVPVAALVRHMQSHAGYACLLSSFVGLAVGMLPEQCRALLHGPDQGGGSREDSSASAAQVVVVAAAAEAEEGGGGGGGGWGTARVRGVMRAALDAPLAAALCLESLCGHHRAGTEAGGRQAEAMDVDCGADEWELEGTVVSELAPLLLERRCERRLQVLFHEWWATLALAARGELLPMLMAALRGGGGEPRGVEAVAPVASRAEVQCAPLSLLACSPRVWRTPPLCSLVLDELAMALGALRRRVLHAQVVRADQVGNVVLAQHTAVVQMLLEACLPTAAAAACDSSDLAEAQQLLLATVSEMFLDSPLLLKAVHFQGYPPSAVPLVVARVPAVHAAAAFLPELLSQPASAGTSLFAVVLAAELAARYPLEATLQPAATALAMAAVAADAADQSFVVTALPSLCRAAATFPSLLPATLSIVHQCTLGSPLLKAAATTAFDELLRRRVLMH